MTERRLRQTKRVALDTNYARYAAPAALEQLRARGFRLSVPMSILGEWWAGALKRDRDGREHERFRGRLRTLVPLLDEEEPILPDGDVLQRYLHAHATRAPGIRRAASIDARQRLLGLMQEGVSEALWRRIGQVALDHVTEAEDIFMDSIRAARSRPRPELAQPLVPAEAAASGKFVLAEHTRLIQLLPRNDGFFSVFALRATRAFTEPPHASTRIEPNDAQDHKLLTNLGWPSFVATKDFRLIRDVDESGTVQRPWVRTIYELLNEPLPLGPTWGRPARRAAEQFVRPCSYDELRDRDERLLAELKGRPAAPPTEADQ